MTVSNGASSDNQTPEPKRSLKSAARSEIARIGYREVEEEKTYEITEPTYNWVGSPTGHKTKQVKEKLTGWKFQAEAYGAEGRYIAGESRLFQADQQGYRLPNWLSCTKDADKALDELLAYLWANHWQPVSIGQHWHDVRLRRVVRKKKTHFLAGNTLAATDLVSCQ